MFPDDDALPCQELSQKSSPIQVQHVNSTDVQPIGSLSLFQHRIVSNGTAGIMYAGGHISAINFHPTSSSLCALAAHRKDSRVHDILKCYKGRAHIQLWNLSLEPNETHCLGVLPHNGNCTWDLKWRPTIPPSDSTENTQVDITSKPPHSDNRTVGTLAAALGDGTAIVATFQDFHIPDIEPSTTSNDNQLSRVLTLNPKVMILRAHKKTHHRSPVRVVEWSPDGSRLVLGIANGTVEVYEASSKEKIWPRWCIPAQDTVITGVRWMTSSYLCSVSISCVLRLRDMRNPVSSLEQNVESLAGSLAMEAIEPSVAVVGTDSGTLRVIKLSAIDGTPVKQPVKRIYLQTNALRDIQCISEPGTKSKVPHTLLYTGGSEGIVHECVLPRPIWPTPETCHLARTETRQKLRWTVRHMTDPNKVDLPTITPTSGDANAADVNSSGSGVANGIPDPLSHFRQDDDGLSNNNDGISAVKIDNINKNNHHDSVLHLYIGDELSEGTKLINNGGDAAKENGTGAASSEASKSKKKTRRSRAAGRDGIDRDSNVPKTVLFGSELELSTAVTRVALSKGADLLATGIDDGVLTWVQIRDGSMKMPFKPFEGGKGRPKKNKKLDRKRGRPKKNPAASSKTEAKPLPVEPADEDIDVEAADSEEEGSIDVEKLDGGGDDDHDNKEENHDVDENEDDKTVETKSKKESSKKVSKSTPRTRNTRSQTSTEQTEETKSTNRPTRRSRRVASNKEAATEPKKEENEFEHKNKIGNENEVGTENKDEDEIEIGKDDKTQEKEDDGKDVEIVCALRTNKNDEDKKDDMESNVKDDEHESLEIEETGESKEETDTRSSVVVRLRLRKAKSGVSGGVQKRSGKKKKEAMAKAAAGTKAVTKSKKKVSTEKESTVEKIDYEANNSVVKVKLRLKPGCGEQKEVEKDKGFGVVEAAGEQETATGTGTTTGTGAGAGAGAGAGGSADGSADGSAGTNAQAVIETENISGRERDRDEGEDIDDEVVVQLRVKRGRGEEAEGEEDEKDEHDEHDEHDTRRRTKRTRRPSGGESSGRESLGGSEEPGSGGRQRRARKPSWRVRRD